MTTQPIMFGAIVPQGWKTELVDIDGAEAKWAKVVEVTQLAESLGYDSVWLYDHLHNVPVPAHEAVFECWTALAALSQVTSRVRLGQIVGCAGYRNPGMLAKIAANLDVISGGRLDWGIGAGWYEHEYRAYGYDFPPAADRIRMLAETVEIVRSLWTGPDTHYQGRHFTISGAQCDPKPLQSPHPPILIGGGGPQLTLRVVARLADRSNFGGNPAEFAERCEILARHCDAVGRDYDEIQKTWSPEILVRETDAEVRTFPGSTFGEPFDSWQAGNLVGTPAQVIDKIGAYREMGCTGFIPWFRDYPGTETLSLVAEQVLPAVR
ncbi:MAG TPA: LLM class F420-dependent oxidoreductase [Acidimicrobiales bacterium]|nr:LLM class F420-dependent oxidoreductase [Acidimicrobiales bacterium]